MKIGFFGGSFNPPTNAHINLAKKVLDVCNLDKIIFVPMGNYYQKANLAKAEDRFKMLQIACKASKIKKLEVSDLEIKAEKKLDAIDAFRMISKTFIEDNKFFIMGADNFIKLDSWRESKELTTNYNYIVIERRDIDLKKYIKKYNMKNVQVVENDEYKACSATEFRNLLNKRTKENQDIVAKEVLEFIIENDIY